MKIDLLRHGELEGGIRYRGRMHSPLTVRGSQQMQDVWEQLEGSVEHIYCSPLPRCHDIAQAWQQSSNLPLQADERIQEIDYGDWEGLDIAGITARGDGQLLTRWRQDPTGLCPPNGESHAHMQQRVKDFCQCLQQRDDQVDHVLVIAHSGSLRMMLQVLLNLPASYVRQLLMPYACWTRLRLQDGHWMLEFHNR